SNLRSCHAGAACEHHFIRPRATLAARRLLRQAGQKLERIAIAVWPECDIYKGHTHPLAPARP
ncbi:MAG: hypothetical protein WA376_12710, partial [Terrimicrobiaceae bacterium]